jgi:hypothetical protein
MGSDKVGTVGRALAVVGERLPAMASGVLPTNIGGAGDDETRIERL